MQERKEKLAINQQNRFRTSGNLIKVRIKTKENGSMNMNMETGDITMNITIMALIQ